VISYRNFIKKMNLPTITLKTTERDKKLLAVFGVFALIVSSYYFLYQPMSAKIDTLQIEKAKVDVQVLAATTDLKNEPQILKDYTTILDKVNINTSPFFPKVDPYTDRYILLLEKAVKASGATSNKISFSDPVVGAVPQPVQDKRLQLPSYPLQDLGKKINSANPNANTQNASTSQAAKQATAAVANPATDKALPADALLRLPTTLEIKGSYQQLRVLITNLETLKRAVAIEGVDMNTSDDGSVIAKFTLSFYALEKVDNGADPFNQWTVQGSYGKADMFK